MTDNPIKDSGIEDDPIIPDPDEFETQDDLAEVVTDDENVPDPAEKEN